MRNTLKKPVVIGGLAAVVFACGVNDQPHFKNEKRFGQLPIEQQSEEFLEEEQMEEQQAPSQAVLEVNEKQQKLAPSESVQTEPEEEEVEIEENIDELGPSLISSGYLIGGVDFSSLQFIRNGGTIQPDVVPGLRSRLNKMPFKAAAKFWSRIFLDDINTGDGRLIQDGIASSADYAVMFGGPSESGQQVIYRKNPDEHCIGSFVCVDRLTWAPSEGDEFTVCFLDPDTKKVKLFPYAPNPIYPAKDLMAQAGTYGPFEIVQLQGLTTCDNIERKQVNYRQKFYLRVFSEKIAGGLVNRFQKPNQFKPDVRITLTLDRFSYPYAMNNKPFTDNIFRLQETTRYSLDTQRQEVVKIHKRVRKDLYFPDGQPGVLGKLIEGFNWINPLDGILLNLEVEYCRNNKVVDRPNYCLSGAK